jgi:lactobin A/cerein 7B family class IIb bacteriocin
MKYLNDEELKNISGGGIGLNLIIGISVVITFVIGLIDGIARPLSCNK